ncbi:hypothetical protein Cylst_2719 [Cylindrospermum stagnale PCC 7417]|uniref:DUF4058 family protein n=1 Tax=Cylindrospermum stagnale PCC 7417 TaxID=56107 RepID=K9WYN9_9NOST|nr:DUF4058 family protein [Cylindrospermum stagnale]AFZ24916.1 hypothetical protein Cylst_2719 [Cylindrospermum stagnale PCC 7417]
MPSPFPGMNPYLEHPELFPGLHHLLIIEIARFLSPQLRPKYRVAVEVRMYETIDENSFVTVPAPEPVKVKVPMPVAIKEGYLEVREVGTEELVTTIEILSPTNKRQGKERRIYEKKREQVLASFTNLVEIDLLRKGDFMPMTGKNIQSHYRILICRGNRHPIADLYAFNLPDVIPAFPLPLRSGDSEPVIDLQALLNQVYDIYDYDLVVDYSQEAVPALSEADAVWADALLREKGLR